MSKEHELSTFFGCLCYLKKKGVFDNIYLFIKSNLFHVFFEPLITFYLLESLFVFTKFFNVNIINSVENLTLTIVLPIAISFILLIAFSIILIWNVVKKLANEINNIEETRQFSNFKQVYKKTLKAFHVSGTVMFIIAGYCSVYLLARINGYSFIYQQYLFIAILSIAFGALWNLNNYNANNIVIWELILEHLKYEIKPERSAYKQGYARFMRHIIFWGIILIAIIAIIVVIFTNLSIYITKDIIANYSFLFITFVSLMTVYVKVYVAIYFSSNRNKKPLSDHVKQHELFPRLSQLLEYYNKKEDDVRMENGMVRRRKQPGNCIICGNPLPRMGACRNTCIEECRRIRLRQHYRLTDIRSSRKRR